MIVALVNNMPDSAFIDTENRFRRAIAAAPDGAPSSWLCTRSRTTVLSCLAAHASVLLFDGIERLPRRVKCRGVYPGAVEDASDPLASGLPDVFPVPHSA